MKPPTNRADVVRQVLIWEQVAAAATARARIYRDQLNADATAEYEEQGTAPTWRMLEATVSLPVSRQRPTVQDETALAAWVTRRYPTEVETRVRKGFLSVLESKVRIDDGQVIDPDTGEVVPGVGVQEGGLPGTLRIVAADEVKPIVFNHASDIIAAIDSAMSEPRGVA